MLPLCKYNIYKINTHWWGYPFLNVMKKMCEAKNLLEEKPNLFFPVIIKDRSLCMYIFSPYAFCKLELWQQAILIRNIQQSLLSLPPQDSYVYRCREKKKFHLIDFLFEFFSDQFSVLQRLSLRQLYSCDEKSFQSASFKLSKYIVVLIVFKSTHSHFTFEVSK